MNKLTAIVSIDVETDWGGRLAPSLDNLRGVKEGLPAIFEILRSYQLPATLFVSGQIVPLITDELKQAVNNGCEIASHGFTHRRMPELSPVEIDEELIKSKAILEDATGMPVKGFRAPQARIPQGLHSKLVQHGYLYDSSVFGGKMPTRFQNFNVPSQVYRLGDIWEIPVNQLPLIPLPMGLLWIDLFNFTTFKLAAQITGLPPLVHIYTHPFDMIPAYPVDSVPVGAKLWYTRRRGSALRTLSNLLNFLQKQGYCFVSAWELISRFCLQTTC